jgi:prolyl-tRNA synthetase
VGVLPLLTVVDDLVPQSPNLVAGANEAGYHLRNVNYGRDYSADVVIDITAAQEGSACPECGQPMRAVRGVEVGNIFKLGTRYTEALGATYLDTEGKAHPVIMGSYGIGVGRLLACIAEGHHDDHGLVWPVSIAPFQVQMVLLSGKGKETEVVDLAERLYGELQAAGVEVLLDDRSETPGVKFNDADLIGLPLRMTVSPRALEQGGVEFKRRDQDEKRIIPLADVVAFVQAELSALQAEIDQTVTEVPYTE